jgi:hypothetical protein
MDRGDHKEKESQLSVNIIMGLLVLLAAILIGAYSYYNG